MDPSRPVRIALRFGSNGGNPQHHTLRQGQEERAQPFAGFRGTGRNPDAARCLQVARAHAKLPNWSGVKKIDSFRGGAGA